MRLDENGAVLPDDLPERLDSRWWCPNCSAPTWPLATADGSLHARRCVGCQCVTDLTAVEVARVTHHHEGA